jgi:beta-glucosidase
VNKSLRIPLIAMLLIGCFSIMGCKQNKYTLGKLESQRINNKVATLLAQMTLEEKIGQMTQVRHFYDIGKGDVAAKNLGSAIHTQGPLPGKNAAEWQAKFTELQKEALSTRLGIPLLFGVDAVHGQNTYNGATIFPHNIGMGAAANLELAEEAARITALESQACGFNWVFAPCVAIPLNEKWGRFYEAYAEDAQLTTDLTKAYINGLQRHLNDSTTVLATAKHYIGDGATDYGIEGGSSSIANHEMMKRLIDPYKMAVQQGAGAVMTSFNTIDGLPMHAHKALITDTLKNKLGFDGIVISDWKGYSRFGQAAIINAGIDMVMAVDGDLGLFQNGLKKAVEENRVPMSRIDDAVTRILRQKYRLGLFKNPFPAKSLTTAIGIPEHRAVARQAVRESLVLLKNEDNILPLNKAASKIVVVGAHANNSGYQSGGWTINWQGSKTSYNGATTILDGIKQVAQGTVIYDSLGQGSHPDADAVIIVVGETPYAEFFGDIGDGKGKHQLTLSDSQQHYISHYASQGLKVVTVLVSGRPLVVNKQLAQSQAFVAAWLPGSEGDGIAQVLFGEYDFKGKLPHSWPKSITDYNNKFGPNYWDNSITPLFPFGYGLTYRPQDK